MAQPDIKVLLIETGSGHPDAIYRCLAEYRQLAFGITRAKNVADALEAARDRDIEIAVLDASDEGDSGTQLLAELRIAKFPLQVVAVTGEDSSEVMELGAADHVPISEIQSHELPRALVRQWVRSRDTTRREGDEEDAESPAAREIVEEQREVVDRFHRVEATFKALMPSSGRTYAELSEAERLQLRLNLVEVYIDITKVYYARGDEESEELIRKFCDQLASLRVPPKELTSIHMAGLELMLTEPGQPHREGLISQNRLVFIDILLNLLGLHYSLLSDTEAAAEE